MPSEKQVHAAIVEALVWDGWLILRVNHGQQQREGERSWEIYWQMLGMNAQDSGIADVIALKLLPAAPGIPLSRVNRLLAIEVKAPGKKGKVTTKQQAFLDAVEEHGGIAIVADDLSDISDYLERVEAQ